VIPLASASPFPTVFQLADLLPANGADDSTGFVLPGIDASDWIGRDLTPPGDINGDGIDDLVIGNRHARRTGVHPARQRRLNRQPGARGVPLYYAQAFSGANGARDLSGSTQETGTFPASTREHAA
jgi:hypothetical protein